MVSREKTKPLSMSTPSDMRLDLSALPPPPKVLVNVSDQDEGFKMSFNSSPLNVLHIPKSVGIE